MLQCYTYYTLVQINNLTSLHFYVNVYVTIDFAGNTIYERRPTYELRQLDETNHLLCNDYLLCFSPVYDARYFCNYLSIVTNLWPATSIGHRPKGILSILHLITERR